MSSISFLVPDISAPVLGPVTVIAKSLQSDFDVRIVGPDFGQGVCEMYRGAFDYTVVRTPRLYRYPDFWWESRRLEAALQADVVVAVKSFMHTVPLALRYRRRHGGKVVVYLDEWDGARQQNLPVTKKLRAWLRDVHHPVSEVYFPHVEAMIGRADRVICSSTFLQKRFGGEVIPVGADCDLFRPQPEKTVIELKNQLGLGDDPLVVFGGAVREHKGVEHILEAIVSMGDLKPRLLVVGPITPHLQGMLDSRKYGERLVALGPKPRSEMPLHLSLADVIALPMANTLFAQSQVPCKIFEAMAVGKPIVGTAVSDLPQILEGCGRVVPPERVDLLAEAMAECLTRREAAREMGVKARIRCERMYSVDATRVGWMHVMEGVLGARPESGIPSQETT